MMPIDRSEVLPLGEYERVRPAFRDRVIGDKRARRVAVGEHMSAVFENRDTVLLQIQEMLRTERITREDAVRHEIETYNELVPAEGQLSLTLFVEVPERDTRDQMLAELAGLERHVGLEVDGALVRVHGERADAEAHRTTAVHYLKIDLPPALAERLRQRSARVALVVDHARYQARAELAPETRAAIAADLGWGG